MKVEIPAPKIKTNLKLIDRASNLRVYRLTKPFNLSADELDEAVADGHLVPPIPISVPLKFQREGIKYDDLSEEEKEQARQKHDALFALIPVPDGVRGLSYDVSEQKQKGVVSAEEKSTE